MSQSIALCCQVLQILSTLRSYRAHWKLRAIVGLCFVGLVSSIVWIGFKLVYSQLAAVVHTQQ